MNSIMSIRQVALWLAPPLLGLLLKTPPHPASLQCAQWILLWGVSVVAPLALRLSGPHERLQLALLGNSWLMLVGYLWEGHWLVLASAGWLAVTLAMALTVRGPDLSLRLAFAYAPVGGIWALASRRNRGATGSDRV